MYSSANWNIGWRVRWLKKHNVVDIHWVWKTAEPITAMERSTKIILFAWKVQRCEHTASQICSQRQMACFFVFFQSGELTRWWQKQIINHFVFAHRINLKPLTVLILSCLWFEMFTSCHNRQNTALQHTCFCGAACVVVLQQPCCLLHAIRSRRVNAANGVS